MLALGSTISPSLVQSAITFFYNIFSSSEFIKIGWDFNKNDVKKLMSSGTRDQNGQGSRPPSYVTFALLGSLKAGFLKISSLLSLDQLYIYYQQNPPAGVPRLTQELLSPNTPASEPDIVSISSESYSFVSTELSSSSTFSSSKPSNERKSQIRLPKGDTSIQFLSPLLGYTPSLSDCCRHLLGKPLRKEEQVSTSIHFS